MSFKIENVTGSNQFSDSKKLKHNDMRLLSTNTDI